MKKYRMRRNRFLTLALLVTLSVWGSRCGVSTHTKNEKFASNATKTEPEKSKPSTSKKRTEKDLSLLKKLFEIQQKLFGPENGNQVHVEYQVKIYDYFLGLSDRAEEMEKAWRKVNVLWQKLKEQKSKGMPVDEQEFARVSQQNETLNRELKRLLDERFKKSIKEIIVFLPLVAYKSNQPVFLTGSDLARQQTQSHKVELVQTEQGTMMGITTWPGFNERMGAFSPAISHILPYDLSKEFSLRPVAKPGGASPPPPYPVVYTPVYASWEGDGSVKLDMIIDLDVGFGYAGSSQLNYRIASRQPDPRVALKGERILECVPRKDNDNCQKFTLLLHKKGWHTVAFRVYKGYGKL